MIYRLFIKSTLDLSPLSECLSASAINHNTRKTLFRYWRLAANGDRKSTGSNFGCGFSTFRFSHFPHTPIPFPNHPAVAW
jgi:hypothetical protein